MSNAPRTEKPTLQRLREARQRGDLPISAEFTSSMLSLIGIVSFGILAHNIFGGLRSLISFDINLASRPQNLGHVNISSHTSSQIAQNMVGMLPLVGVALVSALVLGLLSTGGFLFPSKLAPSARKLNVGRNLKAMFSRESLVILLKLLFKLLLAAAVIGGDIPWWSKTIPTLALLQKPDSVNTLWGGIFDLAVRIAIVYAVIGVADLGYRYFTWYQRLRMTREEVKEEVRRSEGNPQIRSRMRSIARRRLRDLLESASVSRVPEATVVVTNPTHFAVAIHYVDGQMRAPRVIAKGRGIVALRIKELARKHNVPIVENKPLAQALYKTVRLKHEIPPELYRAVAEVLGFVYRLRARGRRVVRPAAQQGGRP